MPMVRRMLAVLALAFACGGRGAAAAEPLEVRVNAAIDRAASALVAMQAEDGTWGGPDPAQPLGATCLTAYALLHAGRGEDDPAVSKALRLVGLAPGSTRPPEPKGVYEAACTVLLAHALGPGQDDAIRSVCKWLCDRYDAKAGLWDYPGGGYPDLSNTHYAAMALTAGGKHGFEAPPAIWKRLLEVVPTLQDAAGAFRYRVETPSRASMTHAGILTLQFAGEGLHLKHLPKSAAQAVERGHEWCARNFRVDRAPYGRGWHVGYFYYYMYGLSRYGVLCGLDRIGGHDWYTEGAEELLRRQGADGTWGSVADSDFAILFLRRATFTAPSRRDAAPGEAAPAAPRDPPPPSPQPGVPFLRERLVAGPFPSRKGDDDMLFEEPFDAAKAQPREGGDAGKAKWILHTSDADDLDLAKATQVMNSASWYAAAWIDAPEPCEAVLWVGSDDGCRVWFGGAQVLDGHHHHDSRADAYRVPVALKKGANLLLAHVENVDSAVVLRARLTDPSGAPLAGVTAGARRRAK